MPYGTTVALVVLVVVCAALLVIDLARGHRRRGVIGLVLLAVFVAVLYVTTGFPASTPGRTSFGAGGSIWWAVLAISFGVIFGMIAQYVWSKPETFSWLDFLRPIVVSPLVLLPLIGTLSDTPLEAIQLLSLVLLAFQNGFFWQQVLKDAKPRTG